MEEHVTILGALYVAFNALGILIAIIIFVVISSGGLLSGDMEAIAITSTVGSLIALIIIIFSVPGLIAGIGLLRRRPWARILALIVGCLELMNIPFGTMLGIYTIWVVMKEETTRLFSAQTGTAATGDYPPAS
jgi:p-aminobenzoyl-glutamate transporter AbgT